jgi:uncharacterized protein with FMN-binding domain
MSNREPSLLRRLYPALALTGVGLGLVNVLDRPAPIGAAGAGLQDVTGATGSTAPAGDAVVATTVPTPNSVATQSQGATPVTQAPAVTAAPATQAPAVTQAPVVTAAPAANDCGAVTRTGSEAPITHRRNYGTLVVTASFTSSGTLCRASANYSVYESKSNRYNDYAIPILNQQAVSAAGANIQGVSGATATSSAYQQSLQSAIDQL